MGGFPWITEHWGEILQNVGIISGLFFTAHSAYVEARFRKLQTLAALTKNHREIWSAIYDQPALARVLSPKADLKAKPPTPAEEMLVKFIVLHLATAYRAVQGRFFTTPEKLEEDVRSLFLLPIPSFVWEKLKGYQDADFVAFVEKALKREN